MVISGFHAQYRFLSNFYPCQVEYEGLFYPSVEHAFQAAKTLDIDLRRACACYIKEPNEAKKWGRKLKIRKDWEQVKDQVMADVVWAKFSSHPDLKQKLLDTGDAELVEGNWWGDTYWGVYDGQGENKLGKILMEVRTKLRSA